MKILLAMISALILSSCAIDQCGPTKEKFLENYERFVEKIEGKNLTPDKETWKDLDQTFEKYLSECYPEFENELTSTERADFATTTVRYYYSKYGKGISSQLGIDPKEFTRKLTQNVEDFLHGNEDDIEALVEEFVNRIDREDLDEFLEKGSQIFDSLIDDMEN